MLRTAANAVALTIGGLLGLLVVGYAVLYVVNLHDRRPAAEVQQLLAALQAAPAVDEENNAYLLLLGFAAHPDADPMEVGKQRHAWLEASGAEYRNEDDPLGERFDFRSTRSEATEKLASACVMSRRRVFANV